MCNISGVGTFLKSMNPDVKVVLADPQVSEMGTYNGNVIMSHSYI